jgi:hypothetical protein
MFFILRCYDKVVINCLNKIWIVNFFNYIQRQISYTQLNNPLKYLLILLNFLISIINFNFKLFDETKIIIPGIMDCDKLLLDICNSRKVLR